MSIKTMFATGAVAVALAGSALAGTASAAPARPDNSSQKCTDYYLVIFAGFCATINGNRDTVYYLSWGVSLYDDSRRHLCGEVQLDFFTGSKVAIYRSRHFCINTAHSDGTASGNLPVGRTFKSGTTVMATVLSDPGYYVMPDELSYTITA